VPSQKNSATAGSVVLAFTFVYHQASASGRLGGMQSLKQSLGKGRAACSSKAGRKNAFTINALRSSVSCGQHQTPVSATATARRLGQACLRASQSRRNVCVVKSVLAESTANAVDGCPRGSHWQVIMVRGNQQSVATHLSLRTSDAASEKSAGLYASYDCYSTSVRGAQSSCACGSNSTAAAAAAAVTCTAAAATPCFVFSVPLGSQANSAMGTFDLPRFLPLL
jgi:hypothetical protein